LLEPEEVPVRSELLLLLAARAALVAEVVEPALLQGLVVVADRYELSTLAYQGYGRQLELAEVRAINAFATGALRPDLTLFLDVPVAEGEARHAATRGGADRIEQAGRAFHERVGEAYRLLCSSEPGIARLDGTAPPAQVHEAVLRLLRARFPETFARATG
jgi:dTMP kinase